MSSTFAPERACLPISHWPEPDRRIWLAACAPANLIDEELGARSGHAPISNTKAAKGYGRWLTYLAGAVPEALAAAPAQRITKERVTAYVQHLIDLGNSSYTILARLAELREVAKVMDPRQPWTFISDLASRIRARHKPASKKSNLRPSNELVDLGFELMELAKDLVGLDAAIAYRDGLIIALLALIPLRRRNLADLVLGRMIVRQGSNWTVTFDEDETNTHAAFEIGLPEILNIPLDDYLATHRPALTAREGDGRDRSRGRFGPPRTARR